MASPMYVRMVLSKRGTDLCQEADQNLKPAQKRYKKYYDRRVGFAPIFCVGEYVFLDRPHIFRLVMESSASGGYNKLLTRKQELHNMNCVGGITLQILRDGLKNTSYIPSSTFSFTLTRSCDDEPADKEDHFSEEEHHSDREFDENRCANDNTYIVNSVVRHVGTKTYLRYVVRCKRYSTAEDATKPSNYIPQHFTDAYWRRLDKRRKNQALM